jgi:hypothetical protein
VPDQLGDPDGGAHAQPLLAQAAAAAEVQQQQVLARQQRRQLTERRVQQLLQPPSGGRLAQPLDAGSLVRLRARGAASAFDTFGGGV